MYFFEMLKQVQHDIHEGFEQVKYLMKKEIQR